MKGDERRSNRSHPLARDLFAFRLFGSRAREWLAFDSSVFKGIIGFLGFILGSFYYGSKNPRKALEIFATTHAAACSAWASSIVERILGPATNLKTRQGRDSVLQKVFHEHIENLSPTPQTQKFFDDPKKMFGSFAIVLKSRRRGEKGMITILYS